MLSKSAQRAPIGWEAHVPRIMKASFLTKKKRINVDIIQYDGKEDEKDNFFKRLSTIIQDRQKRNIIILMDDFNSKIGSDNRGYEEIMG